MPDIEICPLDAGCSVYVKLVASGMRETLMEVLGEQRGREMYTLDWLHERVCWHLDASRSCAVVLLAMDRHRDEKANHAEDVFGHTIVRVEQDDDGQTFGLFSTTFVVPVLRRIGLAARLLDAGEAWIRAQGLTRAATDTSQTNTKLIHLFETRGYVVEFQSEEMLRLSKSLVGVET
jgi:GNAT superfamily N-acetyltransferase